MFVDLKNIFLNFWESKGLFDIIVWFLFIYNWGEIKVREIDLYNGKY